MSMLHTVNKSPFESNSLEVCLKHAKDGHDVLLIEDGVYAVSKGGKFNELLKQASAGKGIYALQSDVEARGIQDRVMDGVQLVDYAGFVDLVEKHDKVQSWL